MLIYLLEIGANPFITNKDKVTPIHCAADGNQPLSIAFFQKLGVEIESKTRIQCTPLHHAAMGGCEQALTYLINQKADFGVKDSKGLTPLHHAVWHAQYHDT